jgi:NADPH:quinone reductase
MTHARRWVAKDFGGPEVLEQAAVELDAPGAGEVTVTVRACGMNPADYKHSVPGRTAACCP